MVAVSIQDLKSRLSAWIARVRDGESVLITSHNRPVARLEPVDRSDVHAGARVGHADLARGPGPTTRGRYRAVLSDDRSVDR